MGSERRFDSFEWRNRGVEKVVAIVPAIARYIIIIYLSLLNCLNIVKPDLTIQSPQYLYIKNSSKQSVAIVPIRSESSMLITVEMIRK